MITSAKNSNFLHSFVLFLPQQAYIIKSKKDKDDNVVKAIQHHY